MFWFKGKPEKKSESEVEKPTKEIVKDDYKYLTKRVRWLEVRVWQILGAGSELQRLETLESEMSLWNKRMRFIKNLLDGQTETKCCEHDSCCEIWKAFRFEGTNYCPKCGEFLGFKK